MAIKFPKVILINNSAELISKPVRIIYIVLNDTWYLLIDESSPQSNPFRKSNIDY